VQEAVEGRTAITASPANTSPTPRMLCCW
jgi:hypothetical protein